MKNMRGFLIMLITVIIMGISFYTNFSSLLKDIERTARAEETQIDQYIKLSSNFIDLMTVYGNEYFQNKGSKDSYLYRLLRYNAGTDSYNLDRIMGTQYTNSTGNLTGKGKIPSSGGKLKELGLALDYNKYFHSFYNKLPGIAWIYYTSENNFIDLYPWVSSKGFTFSNVIKTSEFYIHAIPKNNPKRLRYWTPVYLDLAGKGPMVTISSPIYDKNTFKGVVSLDFTNVELSKVVASEYRGFIIDNQDSVIATSDKVDFKDKIIKLKDLRNFNDSRINLIKAGKTNRIVRYGNQYVYMSQFNDAPWKLIVTVPVWFVIFKSALFSIPLIFICVLLLFSLGEIETRRRTEIQLNHYLNEQIEAQKIIKEKEERFQNIFSMLPESAGIVCASDSKIIDVNEAFQETIGLDKNDIVNKTTVDLGLWTDPAERQEVLKIVNSSGEIVNKQARFVGNRGNIFDGLISARIFDIGGIPHIIFIIRDISNEQRAQAEIDKLNQHIRESLEEQVVQRTEELKTVMSQLMEREKMASLGSLVSGIAHEINTPLGIGVTSVSFLEKLNKENRMKLLQGTMTKDELMNFMESLDEGIVILSSNLYRASELIKSFKQIAVTQSNEIRVKFKLLEYVNAVILSLKHEYKNKNYSFEVSCPEDLMLYSFPGCISQIFTNLIMNSLIHGFKGRDIGVIRIEIKKNINAAVINYSDNGVGIPENQITRIYDPFFTTNREHGGSGLGMNIIYNLVTNQLNGTIQCTSILGQETRFIIELPLEGSEYLDE